jgi:hypothetical protein
MNAKEMILNAAVYVEPNCEGIRVLHCEDDYFVGEGEETGERYQVNYDDIDLHTALIYKLVLMNP